MFYHSKNATTVNYGNKNRVVILFTDGHGEFSPILYHLYSFLKIEYNITVVTNFTVSFLHDVKNIVLFNKESLYFRQLYLGYRASKHFRRLYVSISYLYFQTFRIKSIIEGANIVICFDEIGLSFIANQKLNKLIFWPLEIGINHRREIFLKEIFLSRFKDVNFNNVLLIIQDKFRYKNILMLYPYLSVCDYDFVPNSNSPALSKKGNLKQKFFNVEDVIVGSVGMVDKAVCFSEIDNILTKNESFKYVWYTYKEPNLNGETNNFKITVSNASFVELYDIYNNIDIGLVLYNKNSDDLNWSEIGAASGKFFYFLACGKPVVVFKHSQWMSDFVSNNKCGLNINDLLELNLSIEKIRQNYKYYSINAFKSFERLNLQKIFERINLI